MGGEFLKGTVLVKAAMINRLSSDFDTVSVAMKGWGGIVSTTVWFEMTPR